MQILAVFAIALYIMSVIYIVAYFDGKVQLKLMYYLWATYFSIMSLIYLLTIVLLNSKMRKLGGDFASDIRSINW